MSQVYTGTVVELGGEEIGQSGKAKPRKVVIKADPTAQYGKTFRVWEDSDAWAALSGLNGKHVTVIYEAEERQGPQGSYTQNKIIGVDSEGSDGAGVPPPTASGTDAGPNPAPSDNHSDWGAPPTDTWGVGPTETVKDPSLAAVQNRMTEKVTYRQDDMQNQIVASWAIKCAIQSLEPGAEDIAIHARAHELIVMKERIASELSDS